MLKALKPTGAESYGIASSTVVCIERTLGALHSQVSASAMIGYAFSKILLRDKPQPLRLKNATLVFDGRIYPADARVSEVDRVAERLWENGQEVVKEFVRQVDGDFVFVVAEDERLVAGRDVMGARSLFFGENEGFAGLASEKKALWAVGIEKVESFRPGCIAVAGKSGFKFITARELDYPEPTRLSMKEASKKLQTLLELSVRERTRDLKECAVAFSGGLDSSLIASLAKNMKISVQLIHVSLRNQSETEHSKIAAEKLHLPIHSYSLNEADISSVLPRVLRLIETPDPLQTSIGVAVYWVAEKVAEMDLPVLLAGQGADELFGGYKRYVDEYIRHGCEKVLKSMFNDVVELHKNNFERDSKICSFHNVELRLPFATYEVARFASRLPLTLKMNPAADTPRKLVLRRMAANMKLPKDIVNRPKKAVQYATGVNKALKQLARTQNLSVNEYLQKVFLGTLRV
jgi:asparagine synthase (glutamine-hydrolysing)